MPRRLVLGPARLDQLHRLPVRLLRREWRRERVHAVPRVRDHCLEWLLPPRGVPMPAGVLRVGQHVPRVPRGRHVPRRQPRLRARRLVRHHQLDGRLADVCALLPARVMPGWHQRALRCDGRPGWRRHVLGADDLVGHSPPRLAHQRHVGHLRPHALACAAHLLLHWALARSAPRRATADRLARGAGTRLDGGLVGRARPLARQARVRHPPPWQRACPYSHPRPHPITVPLSPPPSAPYPASSRLPGTRQR